jgi:hypothetical protein
MHLRHNAITNFFLILSLVCGIFVGSTAEIQASHKGGRLIVHRAPNFGTDLVVHLSIDGREVADIVRDRHYDGFISTGHHLLTVLALPNLESRRPTSTRLTVQPGHTYVFTAVWESDRVVLKRSALIR